MNTIEPDYILETRGIEVTPNGDQLAQQLRSEWFINQNLNMPEYDVYKIPHTRLNKMIIKIMGYTSIWK